MSLHKDFRNGRLKRKELTKTTNKHHNNRDGAL